MGWWVRWGSEGGDPRRSSKGTGGGAGSGQECAPKRAPARPFQHLGQIQALAAPGATFLASGPSAG